MKKVITLVSSCRECKHCKESDPTAMAINSNYVCEKTGDEIVNVWHARDQEFPPIPDSCPLESEDAEKSDDTIFGDWVYCSQHLGPHTTGWCTVNNMNKVGLGIVGKTAESAKAAGNKCKHLGLKIYSGS